MEDEQDSRAIMDAAGAAGGRAGGRAGIATYSHAATLS